MNYAKFMLLIALLFFYIWFFIILRMRRINLFLLEKIKNGAKILDIRSSKEYSKSHYLKSINIPFNNLFAKKDKLGDLDSEIIVYGKSFNKSYEAKKVLKSMGFKNVFVAGTLKDIPQMEEKKKLVDG
ncbi:rhodanese-like domain-containing protein [Borrelia sp. CA_690]|uniref:Rhodanese-like domain-containing protein n=1 Tax=Borrelia maritima TaxID=2761123 RepID=A0A5J6WCX2_9SPIR|nr:MULTISPECIES: rhodanese-like domain-containing protein [Borrelia]QFI14931.1 rhodanese-like domain-containing protein [Borrelia maritima]WKC84785.1 rhodanese-like domain-containing protein [Borrelia sp. CA_690]